MTAPQQTTTWPEGVTARYLTLAGAALGRADITTDVQGGWVQCHCGYNALLGGTLAKKEAQFHAEKCRAIPHPENH